MTLNLPCGLGTELPVGGHADAVRGRLLWRRPLTLCVKGRRSGKTTHCILRRVATTGKKGPWSEPVSATIEGWATWCVRDAPYTLFLRLFVCGVGQDDYVAAFDLQSTLME